LTGILRRASNARAALGQESGIEVVVQGPGVNAPRHKLTRRGSRRNSAGHLDVDILACGNSMRSAGMEDKDLAPWHWHGSGGHLPPGPAPMGRLGLRQAVEPPLMMWTHPGAGAPRGVSEIKKLFETLFWTLGRASSRLRKPGTPLSCKHVSP
jgi:hypothetical protein